MENPTAGTPPTRFVPISRILAVVASDFGVTVMAICGPSRLQPLARARQIVMFLGREQKRAGRRVSFPEIGRLLGGRNHSTIMHGVEKVQALYDADDDFKARVDTIRVTLTAPAL